MPEDFLELSGHFEVPERRKNSRQEELQARYESLSKEEQAELMKLIAFPENPRGAELRKKQLLGQITAEEEKELRRLYQLKFRQKNNTPAVVRLWERVEANDPNVEQVDMGNGKLVEVSPTEEEKIIGTFGLNGCYACVVFTEYEDGTRNCVLTHYPPIELSQNIDKLSKLIGASEKMITAKTKKAVLVLPGEWTQEYKMKPKTNRLLMHLYSQFKKNWELILR